ncbi:hypothetical protein [Chryseobacterium sp.]|uniref:hypothetical protein n=1 Tax=Chryseobacterium sp. TaxID=1871047 RepID=UPI0011CB8CA1|nr:hypothetical protein [Chryseobacterium sp.]TXF77748.1 hypothetical protein FUA25_07440 [Chryseobacterium sp.]
MKTHLKTKLRICLSILLLMFSISAVYAQDFSARDIEGNWTRDDGMKISILGTANFEEGGNALVMAVGKSGWPSSTEHYAFKYRKIKHAGGNTWKGVNYRHRVETNARIEDGEAVFIMSDDKKSFRASGYTYRKNQ